MIHKKRVCGASSGLLWLDGHFCSAPILYQAITSVCVCVHRAHWEEKSGSDINTFHLVKWSALHCSAKRRQNPRWRKQFLNVKSSETFTIPWCVTMDPHLFFLYIYTHTYVGIYIKTVGLCECVLACKWWTKRVGQCSNLSFPPIFLFLEVLFLLFSLNSPSLATCEHWTRGHTFSVFLLSTGYHLPSVYRDRSVYSGINSTKSPALGAGNVSEPRLILEEWRTVGPIVWEMEKYYRESRRGEMSYIQ